MNFASRTSGKSRPLFWILAAYLVAVFLMGGASRTDVESLVILMPLSILACTLGFLTLSGRELRDQRGLFLSFGILIVMVALHLVPLPPRIWQSLPGRQEFARVDSLAGIAPMWRPLTLTPSNGWHALTALFAPLAIVTLGVQVRRRDLDRLLPLILLIGVVSALFGLMQVIGSATGSLYLYRVTNSGSAVGLFANRNHAALLLAVLFPMLATWASPTDVGETTAKVRAGAASLIGVVLVPLIIVTGSRSGLILALFGLGAALILYFGAGSNREEGAAGKAGRHRRYGFVAAGIVVAAIAGSLSLLLARGEAIRRLIDSPIAGDMRIERWTVIAQLFRAYFPFGSGAGSMAEIYQAHEPNRFLNLYYFNHAHNDVLEVATTFGLPGVALMLAAVWIYARQCKRLWLDRSVASRSIRAARLASVVMLMIGVASFTDYPLRTPAFMCLFAVMMLWFFRVGRDDRANATDLKP